MVNNKEKILWNLNNEKLGTDEVVTTLLEGEILYSPVVINLEQLTRNTFAEQDIEGFCRCANASGLSLSETKYFLLLLEDYTKFESTKNASEIDLPKNNNSVVILLEIHDKSWSLIAVIRF